MFLAANWLLSDPVNLAKKFNLKLLFYVNPFCSLKCYQ